VLSKISNESWGAENQNIIVNIIPNSMTELNIDEKMSLFLSSVFSSIKNLLSALCIPNWYSTTPIAYTDIRSEKSPNSSVLIRLEYKERRIKLSERINKFPNPYHTTDFEKFELSI
jgi:hypothetical protein